jgi:enamine deaminase RidA (YjgF/YER057c/UK114 family)
MTYDEAQTATSTATGGDLERWRAPGSSWPIEVAHSHAVTSGRLVFVGGGRPPAQEESADLGAQSAAAVASLAEALAGVDATIADVVKLTAFYTVSAGDEASTLAALAEAIGTDSPLTVSAVPVPSQAYPGALIELQAVAIRGAGEAGAKRTASLSDRPELPRPFVDGVRCEEHVFVSMQSPRRQDGTFVAPGDILRQSEVCMERIGEVLGQLGADHDDAVKFNIYYRGHGTAADWEPAAEVRAGYFAEPGPATTGIPVPGFDDPEQQIMMEIWAVRAADGTRPPRRHSWPEGHWDWTIHLPYKHGLECAGLIFVGGQVWMDDKGVITDPGDLERQTTGSMANIARVLAELGAGLDDVLWVNAYNSGKEPGEDDYRALSLRAAEFPAPGPVTVEMLLPVLAYEGMRTEIEVIAGARN